MKKKRFIYVLALFLILSVLFILFYFINLCAPDKVTRSTNLSSESIGGFKVHDSINNQSFRKRYGRPMSREDNDLYDYYHWKDGLETASIISGSEKGSIMRFIIAGPIGQDGSIIDLFGNTLHTSGGIKLGDSKKKVISKYGKNYYKFFDDGSGENVIGYVDHKLGLKLEFELTYGSNQVVRIYLEDEKVE
ncbi:hypothetical protein [Sporolactobacillus laevolacticus]|uniref:hypothetical protein n=1 Tax=Sporolactobacillus laevolacticus TaxID=33018 RepID=UPI0025B52972|nr:hypothetical protein [Sporolactobacillus laevolacticus]MDN3954472.1 hypothetical protein [Sporolactobacillus laevolacticus]